MHTHAISLQSFGIIGSQLLKNNKQGWKKIISKLKEIDWRRSNAEAWEGRTLIGGRIAKTTTSIILTVNYIKQFLGLELTEEEQQELTKMIHKAKSIIEEEIKPDGYNIGMKCGATSGQTVMHFHCHIIPRFKGDVDNPSGGVRHCIMHKGYY